MTAHRPSVPEPPLVGPPAAIPQRHGLVRVKVWDLVVRSTHWVIAVSMAVLVVTGFYLGDPYTVSSGEAGEHFVMGTNRAVHFYAAIAFTLAVLSRIVWMFIGPPNARWQQFIPVTRERRKALKETFLFYIWFRPTPPPATGHNALAGFAYTFVFLLYLVMIATGMGLYAIQADVGSPLAWFDWILGIFGGVQGARWWHHVVMWLLIGFVVHHIYSAIYMSIIEKNGTIGSIFSGDKWEERK